MDDLLTKINNLSIKYTKETEKEYLKKYGQFFTLDPIMLDKLLDDYKFKPNSKILEPSFGTGIILHKYRDAEMKFNLKCQEEEICTSVIDAVEIDKNIHNKTLKIFKSNYNINFINADFLKEENLRENSYDLIVGNPPYFEMKKDEIVKSFEEITKGSGRVNIYSLFIYKSIKLLKENGELRFIIPKTILSGKYFNKLRIWMSKQCDIIDIVKFDKNNMFTKALQSVIILKLKKRKENFKPNEKYLYKINNNVYFVKEHKNLFLDEDTKTILELNCKVKTGSIVWNQHKELLQEKQLENNLPLIMSSNLSKGKLTLNEDKKVDKKQFIKIIDSNKQLIISGPFILINRIVGMNPPKINMYFEKKSDKKYFIENHVNIISGKLTNLTKIYKSLNNPKTITFINEIIGNTQLSQDELENLIPIFTIN
jgi:adenine-specific DNA-methyltransferase